MLLKTALISASALAVLAVTIPHAQAQTPANALFGGGGTLAAKLYRDVFNCYSTTADGIYSTSTPTSGTYPAGLNAKCTSHLSNAVAFGYEPVGSGAGLKAFDSGNTTTFGTPSATNPVAYLNAAAGISSAPYPEAEFVGSDAYLLATDIAAANAVDGGAAIFQIPTLATPITLPVGQVNGVTLTTNNVCDVFSGQAAVPNNSGAQQIYVRADGSGTSFIFSEWLSKNCTGTGAQGKAYAFTSTNGFPSTAPNWTAAHVGSLGVITPVTGSGGIASAVAGVKYSIGYVSPDYVQPIITTGVGGADYPAMVNGVAPTVATVTTRLSKLVVPATYNNNIGATLNDTLASSAGTSGYPIVGFTFVDTYGCYSATYAGGKIGTSAKGDLLKAELTSTYNGGTFSLEAAQIIQASGFVSPPASVISLFTGAGGPLSSSGINGTQCPAGRT